ncbi:Fe-S cluster assembly protein SufD [Lichenicola cladoniae]|uniref:Fe-S cluster assembly protein SufD n=1 Tax=Lichenicola cladoniae TaxID=1484109 RepID=A0A6M8HPY5_9PROT|nr:Fe-S cluster assembly protein SufD [Lichenicola cladoniae]NPD67943.1 Fe-S cluster assembly protein SufD [Acetobacteraceae bacterium]QKE90533.1 Fe-S cluster assembly protein SufD [Lichenicola cladoniae]
MNAILPLGSAEPAANAVGFLAHYEATRDRLAGDVSARDEAANWLRRHGFPSRREEAWRYTSLRPVWDTAFEQQSVDGAAAERLFRAVMTNAGLDVDGEAALKRLVFVNGVLSTALTTASRALFTGPELGEPLRHPMVALNTMLATDGATIHVPAGVDGGRLLIVTLGLGTGGAAAFHLRHRIVLEQGASLSLFEIASGEGTYLHETVSDFSVALGAHARHVRLQQDAPDAFSFSTIRAAVAERGAYDGFNLALGASLARHEVHATLSGPHGAVHVNGAQLLGGQQVADLTSVISHEAPDCISRQTVKNVLTERSRGVFQGKIFVARIAQKTDGYQMNQALLLSENAEIDCKPELEIYADDVKCSHGATAGALDEEQLFYMRSRGVPETEARSILVRAFLDDALALVEDELVRGVLDRAVEHWWVGRIT